MALEAGNRGPAVCQPGCRETSYVDWLWPQCVGYAVADEHPGLVHECCEKGKDVPMQLVTDEGGEGDREHLERAEKNFC